MTSKPMRQKRSAKIDWDELHRRLGQARGAIERTDEAGRSNRNEILRERAVNLARSATPIQAGQLEEHCIEVLEFRSAGERYAFETAYVAQVYPICSITPIPGVPNFVVGIIMSQGEVLSIIDLRSLLDLPISGLADPTSIIVLKGGAMELGILAEEILGIERYPATSVERELPTLSDTMKTYLKAVSHNRTAILSADLLLSDPRLIVEIG